MTAEEWAACRPRRMIKERDAEVCERIIAARDGDAASFTWLVRKFNRLIHGCAFRAWRFQARMQGADLTQEAKIGFLKAVRTFKFGEACFLTYAKLVIRRQLLRVSNQSEFIRPPHGSGRSSAIGRGMGAPPIHVGRLTKSCGNAIEYRHDFVIDEAEESARRTELVRMAMNGLKPRHRQALIGRMGGSTLEEVGKTLGISRERVRQLEMIAMRHVTEALSGHEEELMP